MFLKYGINSATMNTKKGQEPFFSVHNDIVGNRTLRGPELSETVRWTVEQRGVRRRPKGEPRTADAKHTLSRHFHHRIHNSDGYFHRWDCFSGTLTFLVVDY